MERVAEVPEGTRPITADADYVSYSSLAQRNPLDSTSSLNRTAILSQASAKPVSGVTTAEAVEPAIPLHMKPGFRLRKCGLESCSISRELRPCYGCFDEYYCCVEHQLAHWPLHVVTCKERDPENPPRLFDYFTSILSESQLERVKTWKQILKDYVKFSLSDQIKLLESEVEPERQVFGWERLAMAYQECISSRPGKTGKLTKAKIYATLVAACTHGPDIANLKKVCVPARKLGLKHGQLEKILDIWASAGCIHPLSLWLTAGGKKKKGKGKGKGKGKAKF